ncbi:DUF4347 domain-containing protein [Oscillatoria sp. FACHB-1407]|uniref:DUF4347 domain-containing protein n=1 Tax=Oscillatoria sp. FACHB-1407 TaxID=2692847 RepID=UPI001684D526|nr:DUF4347 domain-containing protein [Oscillatoria sp. FACHB-1407]MBD2465832.1 DUF4347 domain-containing protein [Oscillatoria sp. FACHB-1407]
MSTITQAASIQDATAVTATRAIAIIDAALPDYQSLVAGVTPGTEVVILDSTQDGVTQITAALQAHQNLDSIQIFAHGSSGQLLLGNTVLNNESLAAYADQLQQWQSALTNQGDLLIYGCDVVREDTTFIDRLSQLTGADVAASTNLTGAASLGGDWVLEASTGAIEAQNSLRSDVLQNYNGVMNVITVTTTADSGAGSLRAAIAAATAGTTIQFAANLANQTITLTSGQLEIAPGKNITIDGSAAAGLRISGNNSSRIFLVRSNQDFPTTVTFRNLSLINGFTTDRGAAIHGEHRANITVDNVGFQNNVANKGGGAIYSAWENQLTVTNSQFDSNRATAGNDERGAGAIAFLSPGNFTVRNSSFTNNQGINGGAINSLNGKLTIENSRFVNNSTTAAFYDTGKANPFLRGYGGAIYTDRASSTSETSGTIRIVNSVFDRNRGRGEGGAAYLYTATQDNVIIQSSSFTNNEILPLPNGGNGGNGGGVVVLSNGNNRGLTISSTTFANNTASGQGGGLWMMDAPATITNSTFSGNRVLGTESSRVGGGMALYGPTTIVNSTIANNHAGWVGGGIAANSDPVSVRNTIFSNNTADNGTNAWGIQQHTSRLLTDQGGNLQWPPKRTNNGNDYNATASVTLIDPRLAPLQDNGGGLLTHALLAGSPALNAAVAGAPSTDQRGAQRDSLPDIGAFEVGGVVPTNPGIPTLPTNPNIPIEPTNPTGGNQILGTRGRDVLLGDGGSNTIIGHGAADVLTGGGGGDRFTFRGVSQSDAFLNSRFRAVDRITDFKVLEGDRLQLDYDNNLSTSNRPRGLFNAGQVTGRNLIAAARSAFADKNWRTRGRQALRPNEAVLFKWNRRTYLSVNDRSRGFSNRDLLIDVTGITMPRRDVMAGVLPVNNYFI